MALFESYERRIDQINAELKKHGISSIEEAKKVCDDAGVDAYNITKSIQPICFENACWAYTVGAAIAIKKGCRRAADAAAAIGEGLQAFCIPGSVADTRKVGLGHGNLGKMLLEHYNTPELATALVDLGSLSMVRERLAPDEGEMHTFDTPVRHGPKGGVTTAYHRDRDDDLEIDSEVVDTPVVLKNAETLFWNILKEENITYGYLYNVADKLWYAADTVRDNRFFVLDENFINAHT